MFLRLPQKSFNKDLYTFISNPQKLLLQCMALQKSALKTKAYQSAFIQRSYLAILVLSQCHFRRKQQKNTTETHREL